MNGCSVSHGGSSPGMAFQPQPDILLGLEKSLLQVIQAGSTHWKPPPEHLDLAEEEGTREGGDTFPGGITVT